jgi:PAS domain S-box-containing protein
VRRAFLWKAGAFASLLIAWLSLCVYFALEYKHSAAEQERAHLKGLSASYRFAYRNFENSYGMFFSNVIDNKDIKNLIKEADENEQKRDALRERLYNKLLPQFETLEKIGFGNVAFTFPDGTIFLRMNNPKLYGDRIDEKRPLVSAVKKEKTYKSGFEVGRLVAGFTFCNPLIEDDDFSGIVFASISAKSFAQTMSLDFQGNFGFIINKEIVDAIMMEEPKKYYPESYMSNKFLRDGHFEANTSSEKFVKSLREQTRFEDLMTYSLRTLHLKTDDTPMALSLIPIKMSDGNFGAYFVYYGSDEQYTSMKNELFDKLFIISSLFVLLVIGVYKRQKAAGQLVTRSRQMQAVMDSVPSMIFIKDEKHRWVFANEPFCNFLGSDCEGIYGKSDPDFLPPEEAQRIWEDDDAVIAMGKLVLLEENVTGADGITKTLLTSKQPFTLENGKIGILGVLTNITDRQEAKEMIKRQSELLISQSRYAAMGEMISMIAHQWRQPITAIGMSANNMLLDIALDDMDKQVFERHLGSINGQVEFLSRTIDDFRNFFKPQTEVTSINVCSLIESALKIVGKSLENNGIEIKKDTACDQICTDNSCALTVEVHEGELVQALLVFLGNAKDALLEQNIQNPTIRVCCSSETSDGFTQISVCDNAGGVSDELMQKIFEPYFTTKSAKNGTGLGLYIAKTIVEKYQGGSIGVKNDGEGACFWIRLPLVKQIG